MIDCGRVLADCPASAPFFTWLHCQITLHSVAWWKAASIAVTAILGVIGLLTDVRDKHTTVVNGKHTRKITPWGWTLLAGLLLSATLGVVEQIKETREEDTADQLRSKEILSIVQNTSLITTLAGATAQVTYSLDCKPARTPDCPEEQKLEKWLRKSAVRVYFYSNPDSAKQFLGGSNVPDLLWQLSLNHPDAPDAIGSSGGPGLPDEVSANDYKITPLSPPSARNKIWSAADLPGTTVFLQANDTQLDSASVINFTITLKDGQTILAGPFTRVSIQPQGHPLHPPPPQIAFEYLYPPATQPIPN